MTEKAFTEQAFTEQALTETALTEQAPTARSAHFRSTLFLSTLVLSTMFLQTPVASADEIYLTSGARMKGLVVEEHVDRLVVSTVDGEQIVPRREIDQVFFDDPERNYLYLGHEALAADDVAVATALYRKALQLHPQWEEAQDAVARAMDRRRRLETGWGVPDADAALAATWGLQFEPTTSYPMVAAVTPGAVADQAGLRVGDRLIAVWGESVAFQPTAQVAERLLGPPGTPVKLTVERNVTVTASSAPGSAWPGFDVAMSLGGPSVAAVRPRGVATALREGDLVVAVQDQRTRYLPLATIRRELTRPRKTMVVRIHRAVMVVRPEDSSDIAS